MSHRFLRTLRRLHAWIGLSGAAMGLLFGATGFLMNHRAVMKIEAGRTEERKVQMELPAPAASPEALGQSLAAQLGYPMARVRIRTQPARPARFGGAQVTSAEQWTVVLSGTAHSVRATYTPGARAVDLERRDANLVAALEHLHKGDAGDLPWVLLADAFAGSLAFLALSGILLWTRLAGPRLLAAGLALGGLAALVLVAARAW